VVAYLYRLDDRVIEFRTRMGFAPQAVLCGGRLARRDFEAEHSGQRSGDPWVNHSSLALSVHPLDVKEYRSDAHEKRLNVKIRNDGMVEFRSRRDQKRYCRAYGFVNFDDT